MLLTQESAQAQPSNKEVDMAKKVMIDEEECIGCESCVEICPDVFAFDEEQEKAYVIKAEGGPEDLIEEAMESCPSECIHWEE
ncbi:MAG: ferredoxin [Desulfohalobiaceae bacterium]